jgi:ABC-2 type transport system permease protein
MIRRPGGPWRLAGKVLGILGITVRARLAYLGEMVVRSLFLVVILFVFAQLWRATTASSDLKASTGFTLGQLIWYLVFTEAIAMSTGLRLGEVDQEVRSGDIAYRLARPLPYPMFHLGAALGERLLRFLVCLILGTVVAVAVVGPIHLAPASVAAALASAVVAFCVDWVWSFALALLAFWFEDTSGVQLLYRRAVMLLGGMLVPLDAYPHWLAVVARALPFKLVMYAPARLFVASTPAGLGRLLAAQLAFGAVGALAVAVVYRAGLRRVSAQGG